MASSTEDSAISNHESNAEVEQPISIQNIDDDEGGGDVVELPPAPEREKWGSKIAYLLTLVGYAVGFGNIWRFPYQVRENGGLVYLIPYFTMLGCVGIPLFFLELAVGQRQRKGVVYAWAEMSPRLGGIGVACAWICFMVALYYNTLIAYCLSYLIDSFRSPLPWTSCAQIGTYSEKKYADECKNHAGGRSSKYYWFRRTLDISDDYETPGNFNWWVFLYLLISWTAIYAILVKGTQSVGATVYVTAVFPYLVLAIFFISNLAIEPGKAWLGAYRLLKPKWLLLFNANTWLRAGSQIFYSLGLAEGCLVVYASYNPTRNNCHRDAIVISLINCCTSVFAALVVFPMIGLLGHRKYDECVQEMALLFIDKIPNDIIKAGKDKKDIYFFTKAKTWDEVNTTTISMIFQYGEIGEEDDYHLPKTMGADYKRFDEKLLTPNRTILDTFWLRNCSIGQEATASGGGTGFVFQAFTEAVLHLPGANFWAVLFFLMLISLGLDSGFALVEGVIAAIQDVTHMKRFKATTIATWSCAVVAMILFPFGWGIHILDLLDQWTANWTLLMIAFLECIAVAWDYGLAKISYDVHLMTGSKPNLYILICWKYATPGIIIVMLLASIIQYIMNAVKGTAIKYTAFQPGHNASIDYGDRKLGIPGYAIATGFLLMIFCIVWVPIHFFLRRTRFNFLKHQAPAEFPEEELREERHINVVQEADQFSKIERTLMGRQSLQNLQLHRDNKSQTSLPKVTSSGNISIGKKG